MVFDVLKKLAQCTKKKNGEENDKTQQSHFENK